MGCNNDLMKPLKHMREDIEKMAKTPDIDTHSKKLNNHLDIMVAQAIEHCTALNKISALTKVDKHLTSISSSQLCVVNKPETTAFEWIYSELLNQTVRRRHALKQICKELIILGIDATTIPLDLPFAEYGYHSLTNTIEKGIKLHIGAVLGKFTIPLTVMVTPMNVSDHAEFDNLLQDMNIVDLAESYPRL